MRIEPRLAAPIAVLGMWSLIVGAMPLVQPASPSIDRITFDDGGGYLQPYLDFVERVNENAERVEIYGECASACVTKLAARNLCIGTFARFLVHEARDTPGGLSGRALSDAYEHGPRSKLQEQPEVIPSCARVLFDDRDAYGSGALTTFFARELLEACPSMQRCDLEIELWRLTGELWRMHSEYFHKFGMTLYRNSL